MSPSATGTWIVRNIDVPFFPPGPFPHRERFLSRMLNGQIEITVTVPLIRNIIGR